MRPTEQKVINDETRAASAAKRAADKAALREYILADDATRETLIARRDGESMGAWTRRQSIMETAADSYTRTIRLLARNYSKTEEEVKGMTAKKYSKCSVAEDGAYHYPVDATIVRVAGVPYVVKDTDITNSNDVCAAFSLRVQYLKDKENEQRVESGKDLTEYLKELSKTDSALAAKIQRCIETGAHTLYF